MNVQASHVISMPPVLTMKVLFTVSAMLGILEMDSIVQVSKISPLSNFLYISALTISPLLLLDIDECLSNPCHVNAMCFDNEGSFVCQCKNGFTGNGFVCLGNTCCLHVWLHVADMFG